MPAPVLQHPRHSTFSPGRSPALPATSSKLLFCLSFSFLLLSIRAPTDCTQYFTGVAGNVQSYSYGQMLTSQYYTNCIRTEKGYCGIQWKQSSTTSPDPFGILGTTTTAAGAGASTTTLCTSGFVSIPDLSMDGIAAIPVPLGVQAYQSYMCGTIFGIEGQTTSAALISK